jgi:cytochrome c oxidase subunit 1
LSYAGINVLQSFPGLRSYYQGLTVHGVTNALVLTFAFSNGFLPLLTARALSRPLNGFLVRGTFVAMAAGVALAGYAMLANKASVLYTFYAPLQAHWTSIWGCAGGDQQWAAALNIFVTLGACVEHKGERDPVAGVHLGRSVRHVVPGVAAGGGASGLLPRSLGSWSVDPLLNRTLPLFTAHAIVYAWPGVRGTR